MSVINKMLRDLDQRQDRPASPSSPAVSPAQAALRQGTSSISFGTSPGTPKAGGRTRVGMVLAALLCVAAAAGGWLWWQANPSSQGLAPAPSVTAAMPAAAPVAAAPASEAASAPTTAASAVAVAADPATPDTATATPAADAPANAMTLRMESSLSARRALDALLSTPTPAAPHAAPPAPPMVPAAATPPTPVATIAAGERTKTRPVVAASMASPTPAGDAAPALQRQQQAGSDAMAQAQSLWNSGSHDAAMDLMQQSIAAAERSAKTGSGSAGSAVLNPLVREMARMQLAEGRFGAVWEMLTRLEPLLGNQADLWAIRANAAQRLGRHQDSVHAYMMALQSRPDEQRWLLGTAVSLAALGQTSSAAEMAEKARAVGPVSKDILAYLRQTGVPLREQ